MKEFLLNKIKATGTTVGDVYFPQTELLLPFDGTNGATTTSDLSNRNGTVSFTGSTSISTAQSKFGGSSMYFDGAGDYLRIIDTYWNSALSSGDFTMECWARWDTDQYSVLLSNRGNSGNNTANGFVLNRTSSSTIVMYWYQGGWNYLNSTQGTRTTITENVWYHVAVTRSGSTWKLFLNGTAEDTITNSNSMTNGVNGSLDIGIVQYSPTYYPMAGWIDDLRVTVGVARYTSNFTPPTTAHLTLAGDVNKQIIVNSTADGVAIGTGGINQARISKAWVEFDGSGITINASYNVSSITDHGNRDYTINFSTAMADAYYSIVGSNIGQTSSYNWSVVTGMGTAKTASAARINVPHINDSSIYGNDCDAVNVIVFGN